MVIGRLHVLLPVRVGSPAKAGTTKDPPVEPGAVLCGAERQASRSGGKVVNDGSLVRRQSGRPTETEGPPPLPDKS